MKNAEKWIRIGMIAIIAWIAAKSTRRMLARSYDDRTVENEMHIAYESSTAPAQLNVSCHAADIVIETGDVFRIETDLCGIDVDEEDNVIRIRDDASLFSETKGIITVSVPDGHIFSSVYLETGVGTMEAENIETDELKLEVGAGKAVLHSVSANDVCLLTIGAGTLQADDVIFHNCQADLGVGDTLISGNLYGNNSFDCGVGNLELNLYGNHYRIDMDTGLGNTTVNDRRISDDCVWKEGNDTLEIDGGVGNITVYTDRHA